jgi:hypothetical protein
VITDGACSRYRHRPVGFWITATINAGMSDLSGRCTPAQDRSPRPTCRDTATLDRLLEALVDAFAWTEGKPILAGACPHFDRSFLAAHCPRVDARLHYRHLDVSAFKLAFSDLAQIRYIRGFGAHRALPDIRESLASGQWLYNIWQDASLKEACELGLFIPDEPDPASRPRTDPMTDITNTPLRTRASEHDRQSKHGHV